MAQDRQWVMLELNSIGAKDRLMPSRFARIRNWLVSDGVFFVPLGPVAIVASYTKLLEAFRAAIPAFSAPDFSQGSTMEVVDGQVELEKLAQRFEHRLPAVSGR